AVLLVAGGLTSLQTASLVAALPFTILLLLMALAIVKLLRNEPLPIRSADLRLHRRLSAAAESGTDRSTAADAAGAASEERAASAAATKSESGASGDQGAADGKRET